MSGAGAFVHMMTDNHRQHPPVRFLSLFVHVKSRCFLSRDIDRSIDRLID